MNLYKITTPDAIQGLHSEYHAWAQDEIHARIYFRKAFTFYAERWPDIIQTIEQVKDENMILVKVYW